MGSRSETYPGVEPCSRVRYTSCSTGYVFGPNYPGWIDPSENTDSSTSNLYRKENEKVNPTNVRCHRSSCRYTTCPAYHLKSRNGYLPFKDTNTQCLDGPLRTSVCGTGNDRYVVMVYIPGVPFGIGGTTSLTYRMKSLPDLT